MIFESLIAFLLQPQEYTITNPYSGVLVAEAREEVPPRHEPTLKEQVLQMADDYGVSREMVDNLIECESKWNPEAFNKVSGDVGLWQINSYYHPDVDARNPLEASEWALQRIKDGYAYEWVCANCYLYIKAYFYPKLPKMSEVVPNSYAFEGSIVIFDYNGVKHLAYLSELNDDHFIVKEANYIKGKIAERRVEFTDPRIVGFHDPTY